jgi:methionyl-tRNA formyltransferase
MRILFWGTSSFAVPALRALSGEAFEVAGVVTQPDRPVGRSRSTVAASPVKEAAVEEEIAPVLQPERPRGAEWLETIRALEPDLSVVVAYGHILPKDVIDLPGHGTINVHASLLPRLRGAAPIQAAIREGLAETGVSIMRMVPALDAGPVIIQVPTPIAADETYGELHLRLSELGALALVEALTLLELGTWEERPQDDALATYAPKIDREATRIEWAQPADVVARHIRAFDPVPGALTSLRGADLKLFGARAVGDDVPGDRAVGEPGGVLALRPNGMLVACGSGAVLVVDAQPAGKRRLTVAAWARGRGVAAGDRLGA